MRTASTLSVVTVLLLSAPVVSAMPDFGDHHPPRPFMRLQSSSGASSTSSEKAEGEKPLKFPKGKGGGEYCQMIKAALKKGTSMTPPANDADKFNLTIDLLTKASALCDAMKENQQSSAGPLKDGHKLWMKGGSSSSR